MPRTCTVCCNCKQIVKFLNADLSRQSLNELKLKLKYILTTKKYNAV